MPTQEYSPEQIEQWRSQLDDLAQQPRTVFSKKQAVEALIDPIQTALRVHSYEEVARQLKSWGLEITAGSLKQYVTRYQREHSAQTKSVNRDKRQRSAEAKSKSALASGESHSPRSVNPAETGLTSLVDEVRSFSSSPEKQPQDLDEPDHSSTWSEPTFNRNRVRPQRIPS